jgi:hypothetical protein
MKSNDLRQLDAFAVHAPTPGPVSPAIVHAQPDFNASLVLSIAASGRDDKQIYGPLDIDAGQWSRIRSGAAHFPMTKYTPFAQLVGNDIPLQWLAFKRGYELKPLASDLERQNAQLQEELTQARRELAAVVKFVKETRLG